MTHANSEADRSSRATAPTQYTEIRDVPTDREVVDREGFTWRHGQDPFTGGTAWFYSLDRNRWYRCEAAAGGYSTAVWGPFTEAR